MFYSKNPVFSEKSIVKAEVLQENVLYPMRMFEHLYADYTDGIVTGVRLQAKDTDELLLSPEYLYNSLGNCVSAIGSAPIHRHAAVTYAAPV